jgi:hypothetical protein
VWVSILNAERSTENKSCPASWRLIPPLAYLPKAALGAILVATVGSNGAFAFNGLDPNDFDAFRAHVEAHGLPTGALLIVLAAHAGGSFVSGFVCGLIARRPWYLAATILGILWTCGGVSMLMMLPAPTWFAIADVVLYIPAALLGVKLGGAMTSRSSPQPATQ